MAPLQTPAPSVFGALCVIAARDTRWKSIIQKFCTGKSVKFKIKKINFKMADGEKKVMADEIDKEPMKYENENLKIALEAANNAPHHQ